MKIRFSSLLIAFSCLISSIALCETELQATDKEVDDSLPSSVGRWVHDGEPLKQYPVCYQLWRCESADQTAKNIPSLPKGEWGLCENYATLSPGNICTKCDVPPPSEACF